MQKGNNLDCLANMFISIVTMLAWKRTRSSLIQYECCVLCPKFSFFVLKKETTSPASFTTFSHARFYPSFDIRNWRLLVNIGVFYQQKGALFVVWSSILITSYAACSLNNPHIFIWQVNDAIEPSAFAAPTANEGAITWQSQLHLPATMSGFLLSHCWHMQIIQSFRGIRRCEVTYIT